MSEFFLHFLITNIFGFILIGPTFQKDFHHWLSEIFITEKDDEWSQEVMESAKAILDENEVHDVVDAVKVDLREDHIDGISGDEHHSEKHQAKYMGHVSIITGFSDPTEPEDGGNWDC